MDSLCTLAVGYILGSIAFYLTVYQDMKRLAFEEAKYWKSEYRDFQNKVKEAITAAESLTRTKHNESSEKRQ